MRSSEQTARLRFTPPSGGPTIKASGATRASSRLELSPGAISRHRVYLFRGPMTARSVKTGWMRPTSGGGNRLAPGGPSHLHSWLDHIETMEELRISGSSAAPNDAVQVRTGNDSRPCSLGAAAGGESNTPIAARVGVGRPTMISFGRGMSRTAWWVFMTRSLGRRRRIAEHDPSPLRQSRRPTRSPRPVAQQLPDRQPAALSRAGRFAVDPACPHLLSDK